jgi:hypothetical protein
MRLLPDPDLSLRDATDFIFESEVCRRALLNPDPSSLAVFLRDFLAEIHRLTLSCHLPEFTDHGLQHLCSLIDRLSRWSPPTVDASRSTTVTKMPPTDCATLLLATLFHDLGMLSQRPEDLPESPAGLEAKPLRDVPTWVRDTHILRMEKLVRRLFADSPMASALDTPVCVRAFAIARAHGKWPWEWGPFRFSPTDAGLAAMLAVADLLDEDSNRCDTSTLLHHRYGTHLNYAHWIRHSLSANRILVDRGVITVSLHRPPGTDAQFQVVFQALRNHYKLCLLYLKELRQIGAGILDIKFFPPDACPLDEAAELQHWAKIPGFGTQSALLFHLLSSFMPEALLDPRRLDPVNVVRLRANGLVETDLKEFHRIRGEVELHPIDEQVFLALMS